jgi:hypothetical protein
MDNKAKEFYYIFKRNMGRYILCGRSGKYYKIVGFSYINEYNRGLIVIDSDESSCYCYDEIKRWPGINKIFLDKKHKNQYYYDFYYYPLGEKGYKIVDKR